MSSSDSLCRDFAAYFRSHKLLWVGPVVVGLIWLAVLLRLLSSGSADQHAYVLS